MIHNNGVGSGQSQTQLEAELEAIAALINKTAMHHQQDGRSLLAILRTLEALHRDIRDEMFQQTLPDSRQELYALLRDIEAQGGWPYIHRMKLQSILGRMALDQTGE
ncbi:hypothetical protein IQ268_12885 [Oculatella sp. LEGE 06141]|uniref:hypothetical protein n=1 Tax=Oculatella sp. LEGE 06141 TaxID=1828648 RepID=UPI0018820743|nr:hypothetical protein [Oculatella sp. LEGE 06141]MBE9179458.1 hypothetical protein [Oculatella sp. LEGE 06141]